MRIFLVIIGALILLPLAWKLLSLAFGTAFFVAKLAVFLLVVLFLVGLVRRLLLLR